MKPQFKIKTVTELVKEIKDLLEGEFYNVSIQGEVSNFSRSSAGHYYFSISDSNSMLSCAIFKMDAMRNPIIRRIKDGDKVTISGPISVYQKRGTFQVLVKKISIFGAGDLKAEFEKLKLKLQREGLFDPSHKKEISKNSKKVAIITAIQGAALQDFLNIMRRRSLWFDILIIPSIVQGDQCARSVINAIEKAHNIPGIDTIVIARGGGSIEDLWGFNDEILARKIFDSKIPIISAVGHQTDYTLIDFVSDLRCETPSSAAEVLSSEQILLKNKMKFLGQELKFQIQNFKSMIEKKIMRVNPQSLLLNLQKLINHSKMQLEELNFNKKIDLLKVNEKAQVLDELYSGLHTSIKGQLTYYQNQTNLSHASLKNLNPHNVLKRGYSILSTQSNQLLTSYEEFVNISSNSKINIQFHDGVGEVEKVNAKE